MAICFKSDYENISRNTLRKTMNNLEPEEELEKHNEETVGIKLKKSKNEKPLKEEKKASVGWIVAFVLSLILAIGGSVGFFFLGKRIGNDEGMSSGYEYGYFDGHNDGYNTGYQSGRNYGYNAGYSDGRQKGLSEAGCIMFGGSFCLQ